MSVDIPYMDGMGITEPVVRKKWREMGDWRPKISEDDPSSRVAKTQGVSLTTAPHPINQHSKKSPTGPTERTPKPKYLISLAPYLGVRW